MPRLHAASHEPPRVPAVLAIAAAGVLIAGLTLVALTHGWDYRLAVLLGAWLAVGVLIVGRGAVRSSDIHNRLELEFATAFVATLLCVYVSDWLDWRPFDVDDALAGLTVGLVFVVAGPVRRALRRAADAPDQTIFALHVLVVAPAMVPLLAWLEGQAGALEPGHAATQLAGAGTALALAATAMAFALRGRQYEAAFPLSVTSGLALFVLVVGSGAPLPRAALVGVLGCFGLFLVGMRAWRRADGGRDGWQPGGPLAWLALAAAAIVNVHPAGIGGLVAALAAAWWWFESRRAFPAPEPARSGPIGLVGAFVVAIGALYFALGLLLTAAVSNATGPMVLATIARMTPYRVSDLAFSELLLADQYLWRDTPAAPRLVAASAPDRLVKLLRTEQDRWSGAYLATAWRASEERRLWGTGLELGAESADGLRIAYVYPGSSAERAGVRRGDLIRAIDGVPVGALRTEAAPRHVDSIRLELASPGHAARAATIVLAEYTRSAVSSERVLEAGGRRVGYVVLHDFDRAAGAEFAKAAGRLRAAGIDELVLDLRMNAGGRVNEARVVASAIGGTRVAGGVFQRIVHNERYRDRDRNVPFRDLASAALALPRVFVITSEETCSASEAVINGLAPYMTVVTVGTATCGKPVGMTVVEYGEHAYWVITFRVVNAKGEGDYFNGLRPTCPVEDDFAHELGDPDEASLSAALHYIRHGRCPRGPVSAPA